MIGLDALRRTLPISIKSRLRPLSEALLIRRLAADPSSLRLLRVLRANRSALAGEAVEVTIRPLGGARIRLRPGTTDLTVLLSAFHDEFHLPPDSISSSRASVFLDLGANVGITMAHLAHRYPNTHIIGVELDPGSAAVCRHNVESWAERCEVVEAAVWTSDGQVTYRIRAGHEWGSHVVSGTPALGGTLATARAVSLNSLIREVDPRSPISYVKMDIEGAERDVLRSATEWATRVKCIKVEVHPPYSAEECFHDLRRLGFRVGVDSRNRQIVIGQRPSV